MHIRLKDIIDLDYFINMDEAVDSSEEIHSQTVRDRKIYNQIKDTSQTESTLLLKWLAFRKEQFVKGRDKKKISQLPGTVFSTLFSWMVYAMVLSGSITGISLAYSFLAYHGNRPINVTIFLFLFVLLQVLLLLFTLTLLMLRHVGTKNRKNFFNTSILHTLIFSLFFNVVPKMIKKTGQQVLNKNFDAMEYALSIMRMKGREYDALLFWPVFLMTSVFAFAFSTGALGGTFFRVVVSDMAFGWQSTLMASSEAVYDLVSFIAIPWSWLLPESFAHPTLEQIEGSRIILKDGISTLATPDLVSWWPFICMGILIYGVIPRALLIITGILAQKRVIRHFNLKGPRYRQLMARMQSPVMDIGSDRTKQSKSVEKNVNTDMEKSPCFNNNPKGPDQNVLLLIPQNVYPDDIIKSITRKIENHMFFSVKEIQKISFDFDRDADTIRQMDQGDIYQVILVHEVWQPPIRGILHYIDQLKAIMPEETALCILLTQDAGQVDLFVESTNINYKVWKKAVFKLENPYIIVKRFAEQ